MATRAGSVGAARGSLVWRMLSALFLLAVGGIHLYLVATSTGGLLGTLFTLQAIGAFVLALGIVVVRGRLLALVTVLALVFMVGSLLALVLALTVGLFGLQSSLSYDLAPTSLVVEAIGSVVLLLTTARVLRRGRVR